MLRALALSCGILAASAAVYASEPACSGPPVKRTPVQLRHFEDVNLETCVIFDHHGREMCGGDRAGGGYAKVMAKYMPLHSRLRIEEKELSEKIVDLTARQVQDGGQAYRRVRFQSLRAKRAQMLLDIRREVTQAYVSASGGQAGDAMRDFIGQDYASYVDCGD